MERPCACCKYEEDCGWDSHCIDCKYSGTDKFEPTGKCATCEYDPRKHGICGNCVDYDEYQPNMVLTNTEANAGLHRTEMAGDNVGDSQ